jgi:hypothetical protein
MGICLREASAYALSLEELFVYRNGTTVIGRPWINKISLFVYVTIAALFSPERTSVNSLFLSVSRMPY